MIEAVRLDDAIEVREDQGVLHVVIDVPAARNAINQTRMLALRDVLARAGADPTVRVVALRGAGGHFCAGGAIDSFGAAPADEADLSAEEKQERRIARLESCAGISRLLRTIPQPTVAIIEGAAAGAGMIYALACDFRIASETAFFTTAFAKVGTSGDMGAAAILLELAGPQLARRLLMLSERFDAAAMERMGLVNEVVPADRLEDRVAAFLAELAGGPPLVFAAMKENLALAGTESWDVAVRRECENMVRTLNSSDCREAVAARKAGRPPAFTGR